MDIEVWADVACPFCYLGKHRLQAALKGRPPARIIWHSFQLDPSIKSPPKKSLYDYVAGRSGETRKQAIQMHEELKAEGRAAGIEYNFEKVILANTFDAHRLIHLAIRKKLGDAVEERLFRAYFTEGRDVSDRKTLVSLGKESGLDGGEVKRMLASDDFAKDVLFDENEAVRLGIDAVPFFIIDRKEAIVGAQPVEVFAKVLDSMAKPRRR